VSDPDDVPLPRHGVREPGAGLLGIERDDPMLGRWRDGKTTVSAARMHRRNRAGPVLTSGEIARRRSNEGG